MLHPTVVVVAVTIGVPGLSGPDIVNRHRQRMM
jgi:hypothetical protein